MKPEHHLTGAGNMLDRSGHDFTRDEARDIAMAKISSDRICVEPLICIETRINLYIRIYIYIHIPQTIDSHYTFSSFNRTSRFSASFSLAQNTFLSFADPSGGL